MKSKKTLIVCSLFILTCIGFMIGLKINSDKKDKTQQPILEIEKTIANATDRTGVKPWGSKLEEDLLTNTPSNNELINIYKTIINASKNRDYETFKNNIAKELLWTLENETFIEKSSVQDQIISYTQRDGKEYYLKQGIAELRLFSAPSLDSIEVINTEIINDSEGHLSQVTYFNKDTNEKYVIPSPKTNVVLVECKGLLANNKETLGNIAFTFEGGSWKYLSSHWQEIDAAFEETVGDLFPPDKTITIPDKHETLTIPTVEINEGQVILWYRFSGYIYSIDPTPEIWNSPYLSFAHFSKKFNKKGEFNYMVYDEQNSTFLEGKIIVK